MEYYNIIFYEKSRKLYDKQQFKYVKIPDLITLIKQDSDIIKKIKILTHDTNRDITTSILQKILSKIIHKNEDLINEIIRFI